MFHILERTVHHLSKKQPLQVKQMIPLAHSQLLVIFKEGVITHYQLSNSQTLKHLEMPQFKSLIRAVAVSPTLVVLLIREGRKLLELDLTTYQLRLISTLEVFSYKSHQSQLSEKESLTTTNPISFFKAVGFFFKEQIYEQRRAKIRFFYKKDKEWSAKVKDIGNGISTVDKFDETSRVVVYKQDISQNGLFSFLILTADGQQEEVGLQSASFNATSIIKEVRSVNKRDTVVCVNQRQPEIIYFKDNREDRSEIMQTILLRIFVADSFTININLSEKEQIERMELRDMDLKLLDWIQDSFDEIVSSQKGDWMLSYEKQRDSSKQWLSFKTIKIIRKQSLYMQLMSNHTKKRQLNTTFCRQILELLAQ